MFRVLPFPFLSCRPTLAGWSTNEGHDSSRSDQVEPMFLGRLFAEVCELTEDDVNAENNRSLA
eukprot:8480431-Prorocentrum_lima.AAC.1